MPRSKSSHSENILIRKMRICNKRGLHARASAKFVKVVDSYDACVQVEKDGITVDGASIMGLMMLAASDGCEITVSASGAQAKKVLDTLEKLVKNCFGEDG